MTTVLLDTHVLVWFVSEPRRLSRAALAAARSADTLAVAGVTWYEVGWLAEHGRISLAIPTRSWMEQVAERVLTIGLTPAIAMTAVELGDTFPGDPADRQIYATAIERGWRLITKDERLHQHPSPRPITLW